MGTFQSDPEQARVNVVIVGLATATLTAAGCWLRATHRTDPATARLLLAASRRRVTERHSVPPESNGYAALAHLMAGDSKEIALSDWYAGARDSTEEKIQKDISQFDHDLAEFDITCLPAIDAALACPVLTFPRGWPLEMNSEDAAQRARWIIRARSLVFALVVRGWALERMRRPVDAARCYLRAVSLCGHFSRQGGMAALSWSSMLQFVVTSIEAIAATGDRAAVREILPKLSAEAQNLAPPVERFDEAYLESTELHQRWVRGKPDPAMPSPTRAQRLANMVLGPLFYPLMSGPMENDYLRIRPRVLHGDLDALQNLSQARLRSLYSISIHTTYRVVAHSMKVRTALSAAIIAVACQAWRLDHGTWPAALDALVPEYLAELPADHMASSRRFEYRVEGAQFRLWSNGSQWRHVGMQAPVAFPLR